MQSAAAQMGCQILLLAVHCSSCKMSVRVLVVLQLKMCKMLLGAAHTVYVENGAKRGETTGQIAQSQRLQLQ